MYQLDETEIWRQHHRELLPEASSNGGVDTARGGKGNDQVSANDGQRDVIDCGDGRDSVEFDPGLDKVKNCEVKTPL
jgi:hypothetical protein